MSSMSLDCASFVGRQCGRRCLRTYGCSCTARSWHVIARAWIGGEYSTKGEAMAQKNRSLYLSHFVVRQIWVRRCVSPFRLRANRMKRREPQQCPFAHMYTNCDLLQTPIN